MASAAPLHALAAHVQPDPAVRVRRAGAQHAGKERLARERLARGQARALGKTAHVPVAEAPAPRKRGMVVQAEIILHPDRVRVERRIAGVDAADVAPPCAALRAHAQRRGAALRVHHERKILPVAQRFAKVGVHERMPVVDRQRNAARGEQRPQPLEQAQVDGLLALVQMAGVELLHVDEHHHVVHKRLAAKAQQALRLRLVVEARVAAEAEAIAERVLHGGPHSSRMGRP